MEFTDLTVCEKLMVLMRREGVSYSEIARRLGKNDKGSIWDRLRANTVTEEEIAEIAAVLGYEFVAYFRKIEQADQC